MLKLLRSKASLFLLFHLFLLSSIDLSGQSADAAIIDGGIIISSRPVKGKNKHKTTVTVYAIVTNAKNGEKTRIESRKSATAKTEEASKRKAVRKAKNGFFKQLLKFLGLSKKKDSGDGVMADKDGNGDFKGGLGGLIITFGAGGESFPIPKKGDPGTETFIYNSVDEFNERANMEIENFMNSLDLEK